MRTYCRAQGTLLNALWLPKWEGNPRKRVYIFIYMRLIHFAVQQKLTQHGKTTIFQLKKIGNNMNAHQQGKG